MLKKNKTRLVKGLVCSVCSYLVLFQHKVFAAVSAPSQSDFDFLINSVDGVMVVLKVNWVSALISIVSVGLFVAASFALYKKIKGAFGSAKSSVASWRFQSPFYRASSRQQGPPPGYQEGPPPGW